MGRYYYQDSGRDGKFMFGVQPSDDPEYMGMSENNTTIRYYADDSDVNKIKARLDNQYNILGVPTKDRIYDNPRDKDGKDDIKLYEEWEDRVLHDRVWKTYKSGELPNKYKGSTPWSSSKGAEYVDIEIEDGRCLALARIRLALNILSDIKDDGCCDLEAET